MTTRIFRKAVMLAVAILLPIIATAQEMNDTIRMQELSEIVIQALRKADMDVYHPSKSAVENSQNGIQLLDNLMIPTLTALGLLPYQSHYTDSSLGQ